MATRTVSGVWFLLPVLCLSHAALDAIRPQALPALTEADRLEVARYELTEAVLAKVIGVNVQLLAKVGTDRALREALAKQAAVPSPPTLDEAVRRCEREAEVARLLEGTGLGTREYLVAQIALVQAVAALENVRAGLAKAPRPGSGGLAANLVFVQAHPDPVKRFEEVFDELAATLDAGFRR